MTENQIYRDNLRLSEIEYLLQHIHLWSRPRCLGLVLGNGCNISCPHCYQPKNGDNLLKPAEIGRTLRTEFIGLYPYLSTLRVQGGEVFAYSGFRELLDDVAATVDRPIVSASTNGTLITEDWAERIVRLPFSNLTISIDGPHRKHSPGCERVRNSMRFWPTCGVFRTGKRGWGAGSLTWIRSS